jgi:superfamily II DNA helicase RecQ
MDRAIEDIIRAGDEARANADRVIEEGSVDEANRWIDRTKWSQYLKGHEHEALLDLIDRPDPGSEFVEAAIWNAMDGLGRFSQRTVARRAGLFVRFEAIRSEEQQTRYVPLMAYQDYAAIATYIRPWKQILMFFARTRKAEERHTAPKYRFTDTQKQAWRVFLYEAQDEAQNAEAMIEQQGTHKTKRKGRRRRNNDKEESEGEEYAGQEQPDGEDEAKELTAIQRACLAFCIALLDQKHIHHDYDSAMVCALAVLGVKSPGWKGVDQYPPILSKMIKIARFMVVQQAFEEVQPPAEFGDEGYESDGEDYGSEQGIVDEVDVVSDVDSAIDIEPPASKKGVIEAVRQMMDRFMVRGTAGPMQWMLDLRTYGLKIHYNTTTAGHVQWNEAQTLTYKGITIHMDAFRGFAHAVVNQTREFLRQRLLLGFEPPPIPWQSMHDDPSNEKSRWNFLQDERCRWPVDGKRWLWDQIKASPCQSEAWYDQETERVKRSRVDDYMDDVMEFRGLQLIAGHVSQGGGVPRAPEMLSIRHENTPKGEHRNMFIEDGLVVWVTKYHKGYAISGDIKIIHRYLPRELGELIVWYLWLILPFQFALERRFYWKRPNEGGEQGDGSQESPSRTSVSSHLWPADHRGRQWTSARMREALKRCSREHLGETLTIAAYREIAIAISRRFLRECDAFADDHDRVDDEGSGDGEGGVGRRLQAIMDQQAGHTSHVAGSIYARLVEEMKGSVASSRERFRTASRMWHLWLGFASAENHSETYETIQGGKRKPIESPWQAVVQQQRRAREVLLRSADIEQELRRMLKKDAQFRGMQKSAIEAIVQGHPRIVVVMPTGEGKSFVFQLPAFMAPSGMTIVVVPLTELRRDMIRSCEKLGIVAREWEEDRQVDDATIVFVTPEAAAGGAFQSFMNRNQRKIDRIVIDECHVILNRRSNFRREMGRLGRLVRAEAQMVLVTATLPPSKQAELYERMYWKGLEVDDQHRMRTVRKNIRYSVHVVEKTARGRGGEAATARGREGEAAHDDAVVRIAEAKVRQHQPGKIIVYANSVDKVVRLADQLGVDAYYSEAHLKSEMFQDFRSGRNPMIVATSALGLGIDIPDVRVVVHADTPRCLEEYSQESGRAGRDRQFSEAIAVVQAGEKGYNGGRADFDEPETQALVERFVQDERREERRECRRRVLCEYFDRYDRQHCEDGEEKCDVCAPLDEAADECSVQVVANVTTEQPTIASTPPSETIGVRGSQGVVEVVVRPEDVEASQRLQQDRRQAQRQRQEVIRGAERELATFKRRVREWQRRCTLCAVSGGGETPYDHSLWQCTAEGSAEAQEQMKLAQKAYRIEDGAGCRQCMMPHSMCPKYIIDERSSQYQFERSRACRHNGVIIAGCIGVLWSRRRDVFRQRWIGDMKSKGLTEEEALGWGKGDRLMQLMGKRVVLNDESVCEFAMAFSTTIMRVEWGLERRRI